MTILIFIIMLVVLIVAHEFGHFIVAKLSGMKVPEFGLGFPPKLWGKKIGDTEYTLNALPFGGFVKIEGEDAHESSNDPSAFSNRPKVLQAATLVAGPGANFILAFLLISVSFMVGVPSAVETGDTRVVDPRVVIADVVAGSPAEQAGILPGDRVVSITTNGNTVPVAKPEDVSGGIARATGPVLLDIEREGELRSIEATPQPGLIAEEPERRALGIASVLVGTLRLNPIEAVGAGFIETIERTKAVFAGIVDLIGSAFTLSADVKNIAGPVGIATLTGDAARFGFGSLLSFAAIISINLGILNLLPFPALDGGRLAFLAIETVIRRPIPLGIANAANAIGFALLIMLMIAVTFQDIARLVS